MGFKWQGKTVAPWLMFPSLSVSLTAPPPSLISVNEDISLAFVVFLLSRF